MSNIVTNCKDPARTLILDTLAALQSPFCLIFNGFFSRKISFDYPGTQVSKISFIIVYSICYCSVSKPNVSIHYLIVFSNFYCLIRFKSWVFHCPSSLSSLVILETLHGLLLFILGCTSSISETTPSIIQYEQCRERQDQVWEEDSTAAIHRLSFP